MISMYEFDTRRKLAKFDIHECKKDDQFVCYLVDVEQYHHDLSHAKYHRFVSKSELDDIINQVLKSKTFETNVNPYTINIE